MNNELVIILGKQLHRDGSMPRDLIDRLEAVVERSQSHPDMHILVSGKYGIEYDEQGFIPSFYECDVMYDYLVSKDVEAGLISKECESKDTISNIMYAKDFLIAHPQYKKVIVVCATHHQPRVKLLIDRTFGNSYVVSYLTVNAHPSQQELNLELKEINRINDTY